jgi:hypothetical protein
MSDRLGLTCEIDINPANIGACLGYPSFAMLTPISSIDLIIKHIM